MYLLTSFKDYATPEHSTCPDVGEHRGRDSLSDRALWPGATLVLASLPLSTIRQPLGIMQLLNSNTSISKSDSGFLLWLVADTYGKVTQYIQANAVVFVPGCLVHPSVQVCCWKHLMKMQVLLCMQETWHITALTTLHVLQQLLKKSIELNAREYFLFMEKK